MDRRRARERDEEADRLTSRRTRAAPHTGEPVVGQPDEASKPSAREAVLPVGSAGVDEAVSVAWPLLLRDRLAHRARTSDRRHRWVLWTVLGGLFSINVTFTLVAVALPRIAGELETTTNTLTWVVTGPLLGFGVAAPIAGKLGDLHGHRRLFLVGLAAAGLFAALTGLAWDAGSLIAFRVLGALGGAAAGPASMALILAEFDRHDRVKAMGWWSLVGAGGPVIGVALGGAVVQAVGWRWVFLAQAPLAALAFLVAVPVLHETGGGERSKLDWAGALALATAATSAMFALNRAPEWGWTSTGTVASLVLAPLALVAFVLVERRAPEPLLPLELLRRRNFAIPIATQVFANFAYMGGFILAPLLLARVFGFQESTIGLFVLSRPLAFSLTAPIAGHVAVKVGERVSAVVGVSAVLVSMLLFAALNGTSPPALIVVALVLSGMGLGISQPSISSSVANAVDERDLGIASASQQLVTQVGVIAGIQLMSTVQAASEPAAGVAGSFDNAYLLGAAVCAVGAVCAAFVRSDPRTARRAEGAARGALR